MPTTGRSFLLPLGIPFPSVAQANMLAARTGVLYWIGVAFHLTVGLEQPVHRSVGGGLIRLPLWQRLVDHDAMYRHQVFQGQYGASTLKPTWIYSNHKRWSGLHSGLPDREEMERISRAANCPKLVAKRLRATLTCREGVWVDSVGALYKCLAAHGIY